MLLPDALKSSTMSCTTGFQSVFTSHSWHLFAASLLEGCPQAAGIHIAFCGRCKVSSAWKGPCSFPVHHKLRLRRGGINKYFSSSGTWLGFCEAWLQSKPRCTTVTFHLTSLDVPHLVDPLCCCLSVFYWKYFLINHFHMNPERPTLKTLTWHLEILNPLFQFPSKQATV